MLPLLWQLNLNFQTLVFRTLESIELSPPFPSLEPAQEWADFFCKNMKWEMMEYVDSESSEFWNRNALRNNLLLQFQLRLYSDTQFLTGWIWSEYDLGSKPDSANPEVWNLRPCSSLLESGAADSSSGTGLFCWLHEATHRQLFAHRRSPRLWAVSGLVDGSHSDQCWGSLWASSYRKMTHPRSKETAWSVRASCSVVGAPVYLTPYPGPSIESGLPVYLLR